MKTATKLFLTLAFALAANLTLVATSEAGNPGGNSHNHSNHNHSNHNHHNFHNHHYHYGYGHYPYNNYYHGNYNYGHYGYNHGISVGNQNFRFQYRW